MTTGFPDLHLISYALCPYVQRARIILNEKAIPHRLTFIDLGDKPDWFVACSPLGQVPVLLVDERPLFESTAIIEYLDELTGGTLLPGEAFDRGRCRAWIAFGSDILNQLYPLLIAKDEPGVRAASDKLRDRFEHLEPVLGDGVFFLGRDFSLVDVACAPMFRYFDLLDRYPGLAWLPDFPAVQRWRTALAGRASVRDAANPDFDDRLRQSIASRDSVIGHWLESECARA